MLPTGSIQLPLQLSFELLISCIGMVKHALLLLFHMSLPCSPLLCQHELSAAAWRPPSGPELQTPSKGCSHRCPVPVQQQGAGVVPSEVGVGTKDVVAKAVLLQRTVTVTVAFLKIRASGSHSNVHMPLFVSLMPPALCTAPSTSTKTPHERSRPSHVYTYMDTLNAKVSD